MVTLLRCQRHRWCTLSCKYLCEFSTKFKTAILGYSGAWGNLIQEKNLSQKSRGTVPLKNFCFFLHLENTVVTTKGFSVPKQRALVIKCCTKVTQTACMAQQVIAIRRAFLYSDPEPAFYPMSFTGSNKGFRPYDQLSEAVSLNIFKPLVVLAMS